MVEGRWSTRRVSLTARGVQRGLAPLPGARGCPPSLAISPPSWREPALSLSKGTEPGDGRNGRGAPSLGERSKGFEAAHDDARVAKVGPARR